MLVTSDNLVRLDIEFKGILLIDLMFSKIKKKVKEISINVYIRKYTPQRILFKITAVNIQLE